MVGLREPSIYGSVSFEEYIPQLKEKYPTLDISYFQSNHEGHLIDYIHKFGLNSNNYGIINAGGLSHTSICLMDAISAVPMDFIEVHISNINEREAFRQKSYLTEVCLHCIMGEGLKGYDIAIDYLLAKEDKR